MFLAKIMFISSSLSNSLGLSSTTHLSQNAPQLHSSLQSAKEALRDALEKACFCDSQGKVIASIPHPLPLDDEGITKLNTLLSKSLKVKDREFSIHDYLHGLLIPRSPAAYSRYLRGSYAAYVLNPLKQLAFALDCFYQDKPEAKALIHPCFEAYCALRPQVEEPHDADFADLFFAEGWKMTAEFVKNMRDRIIHSTALLLGKDYGWTLQNGFETLFIPQPNALTKRAERIAIATLRTEADPKTVKVDRIVGQLKYYCLFSRDDFYINLFAAELYPLSLQSSFWQSILDREMNVIRLEKRHKKDFSSVLAAVEHYTKGASIDESIVSLNEIFEIFLKPLTEEEIKDPKLSRMELNHHKLVDVVFKRMENHQVDPLSFLVNLCQKMPEKYADRRESLWRDVLKKISKEKLGSFRFLAEAPTSFELFINDVISLKGSEALNPHNFRIDRPTQDRIGVAHRQFRKLILLQGKCSQQERNQNVWQAGCNALYSASKSQILTSDFVDLLIEDLMDNSVYSEKEVDQVFSLCEPFLGPLRLNGWLEDLLKGPYWEKALPYWEKGKKSFTALETFQHLLSLLPKAANGWIQGKFLQLIHSAPLENREKWFEKLYSSLTEQSHNQLKTLFLQELCKEPESCLSHLASLAYEKKDWELLKDLIFRIENSKGFETWAIALIGQENRDQEALALLNRFNGTIKIEQLPKKLRDRLHNEIRNPNEPEALIYVKRLLEQGSIQEALSLATSERLPKELWDEAIEQMKKASLDSFKGCLPYLYKYSKSLNELIVHFNEEKQAVLISDASMEVVTELFEKELISLKLYLNRLKQQFKKESSLSLLWKLERYGETPDPVRAKKLYDQMRSAKEVKVEVSLVEERLDWLNQKRRYREAFLLLEKSPQLPDRNDLKLMILEKFIAEASYEDLTEFFSKDLTCLIPENAIIKKVRATESAKGIFTLYLKLKSRLLPQENFDVLLNLLEKQQKIGNMSDKELQSLLSECFNYSSDRFSNLLKEFLICEACRLRLSPSLKKWLEEEPPVTFESLHPSTKEKWIACYFQENVAFPKAYISEALALINTELKVNDPAMISWLLHQIAIHSPQSLESLSLKNLPIALLFKNCLEIMVAHFSLHQLWEVRKLIGNQYEMLLQLFRAWHIRGDLNLDRMQIELLASAPSVQALYPVLKWMKELHLTPLQSWGRRYLEMDELSLGLYFELLADKDITTAFEIVQFSVNNKKNCFFLNHGPLILSTLQKAQADSSLIQEFQTLYLQRIQVKKQLSMNDITVLGGIFEEVKDSLLKDQYNTLIFGALLKINLNDALARSRLFELMRQNKVIILTDWKQPLFSFLDHNREEILNSIEQFGGGLEQVYQVFADSENFVFQALQNWNQWNNDYRIKLAGNYLVKHPQSLEKFIEIFSEKMFANQINVEEVSKVATCLNEDDRNSLSSQLLVLLYHVLKTRQVLREGSPYLAVNYFFSTLITLSLVKKSVDFDFDLENHLGLLLESLVEKNAFYEVSLLYHRYVLYKIDEKRIISFNESLEGEIDGELKSEEGAKLLFFAMQESLKFFTNRIHERRCFDEIDQKLNEKFEVALKSKREAGAPIPVEWFPYYQSWIGWCVRQWIFIIEKTPKDNMKVLIPEIISFLVKTESHPACNEHTFQFLRLMTRAIFGATVYSSNLLVLLMQFVICESMGFGDPQIYRSEKMEKSRDVFTKLFSSIFDSMLKDLRERGGFIEFQRAFKLMIYSYTNYQMITKEMGMFCFPLYERFLEKLPHADIQFKKELVPLAYHLFSLLQETKYITEARKKLDRLTGN